MTDLPNGWQHGGGEASRPLHEGGYYLHNYSRMLSGSNQHLKRVFEIRVDTANWTKTEGPTEHVIELNEREYDDGGTIVSRRKTTDSVEVEDRNDPESQAEAEERARDLAHELMEEHPQ